MATFEECIQEIRKLKEENCMLKMLAQSLQNKQKIEAGEVTPKYDEEEPMPEFELVPDISQGMKDLFSTLRELSAENIRLKRGDFTQEELQTLCHNLNPCDRLTFRMGCDKYQRELFGEEKLFETSAWFSTYCQACTDDQLFCLLKIIQEYARLRLIPADPTQCLLSEETKEEMQKRFIRLCSTLNAADLELLRVTIEKYSHPLSSACRSYAEKAKNPLPPNHESPTSSLQKLESEDTCTGIRREPFVLNPDFLRAIDDSLNTIPQPPQEPDKVPPTVAPFWYLDGYE